MCMFEEQQGGCYGRSRLRDTKEVPEEIMGGLAGGCDG